MVVDLIENKVGSDDNNFKESITTTSDLDQGRQIIVDLKNTLSSSSESAGSEEEENVNSDDTIENRLVAAASEKVEIEENVVIKTPSVEVDERRIVEETPNNVSLLNCELNVSHLIKNNSCNSLPERLVLSVLNQDEQKEREAYKIAYQQQFSPCDTDKESHDKFLNN